MRIINKMEKLEWNVYYEDINNKKIDTFNVFHHWQFLEYCKKNAKQNKENYNTFVDQLKKDAMYCFWSKCEWEIILSDWPPSNKFKKEKIDVYDQLCLNWDIFCKYVWEHITDLRRE